MEITAVMSIGIQMDSVTGPMFDPALALPIVGVAVGAPLIKTGLTDI
jgi:hypothetical protein